MKLRIWGLFLMVLTFGFVAHAQDATDGELEISLLMLVDAVKIGQIGAIITALIQLVKTRVGLMLLGWLTAKLGWSWLQKKPQDVGPDLSGYVPIPMPSVNPAVIPGMSLALGGVVGIVEAIATGKPVVQAIFEGLLSGGVSMALYDSIIQPLIKKFKK